MIDYQYLYRTHLPSFVGFAFRILHPGERIEENWHVPLLGNLLDFVWRTKDPEAARFRRLIFNLPPESLKTHLCGVSFPAWILGRDPRQSVLIVSETPEHARAIRDSCVELMESARYKAIFPRTKIKRISRDLQLTHGGGIRHAGIGYPLPHRQSDLVVIDNPESPHRIDPRRYGSLQEAGRLLKKPDQGMIVLATRRVGPSDMSDFLQGKGGWTNVSMPAVALEEKKWQLPPDCECTPHRGEPLTWRLGWDELEARFHEMGWEAFAYQYLQKNFTPFPSLRGNMRITEDGRVVMVSSKPNLERIVANTMRDLRQEYEDHVEKVREIIRSTPLHPAHLSV